MEIRWNSMKKGEDQVVRRPNRRHWIRSRLWDKFRDWVQTETQRCCAGQAAQAAPGAYKL